MTAEIKSSLQDIWSKDHLTFDNFQIFKQEKVDKLVDKFPQKYCEVQEDSSEDEVEITEEVVKKGGSRGSKNRKKKPTPPAKKSSPPVKSPVTRGKEPSEWASILFLNSGDNDIAGYTQDALNKKFNLTVTPVSIPVLFMNILLVGTIIINGKWSSTLPVIQ